MTTTVTITMLDRDEQGRSRAALVFPSMSFDVTAWVYHKDGDFVTFEVEASADTWVKDYFAEEFARAKARQ